MWGSWWRGCSTQGQTAWYIRRHKRPRPNTSQISLTKLRSRHTQPIILSPFHPLQSTQLRAKLSFTMLSYALPSSGCTTLLAFLPQLALLKSQCTLSHTHFLLSKATVNEHQPSAMPSCRNPQQRQRASYLPISTSPLLPILGCRTRLPCGSFRYLPGLRRSLRGPFRRHVCMAS
jgi:hypothetical protein